MTFPTAHEAADLLRVKIDKLYSLIEKDALPGAKLGGQGRFPEDAARAAINRKFVDATFDAVLVTKDRFIFPLQ